MGTKTDMDLFLTAGWEQKHDMVLVFFFTAGWEQQMILIYIFFSESAFWETKK